MWSVKSPTKTLKDRVKFMGKGYEVKTIDGENCIYRKLQNGVNFEVSGADNNREKTLSMSVYTWFSGSIIEEVHGVKTLDMLKTSMDYLTHKYEKYTHGGLTALRKRLHSKYS